MGAIASKITSLTMVYSTGYPDADQRKHQSSASLAFVRGIQWPVTRKMFPFDDVIMYRCQDGDVAAVRSENFLPAHASLRPPTSFKFATKKHSMGGMVRLAPKRKTRTFPRFRLIISEIFVARRRYAKSSDKTDDVSLIDEFHKCEPS